MKMKLVTKSGSLCAVFLLFTLHLTEVVQAIYDPKATTTKPPVRRESILPWYLNGSNSHPPDDGSRLPKWSRPDDFGGTHQLVEPSAGTWGNWRKVSGSEIEQRTEIETGLLSQTPIGHDPPSGSDQAWVNEPFEKPMPKFDASDPYDAQREIFYDDANLAANRKNPSVPNVKQTPTVSGDSPNLYEGVVDSKKPRQERILVPIHSSQTSKVAKYVRGSGVQCPNPHATGQFVYPPDCKFFVNCHQGRAFVQPCAPGTLFNPETLECDFPHKVRCYGGEISDFPNADYTDGNGRREPLVNPHREPHQQYGGHHSNIGNEPRCPPQQSGYFPHPSDCTKFIQCANGGTFIKDCGPGTVFNPTISVCDWPYNVMGCEDAYKKNDGPSAILTPPEVHPHENYQTGPSSPWKPMYKQEKKIQCPPDHSGLLPHPETCKKFLQCSNGITYIMDCGPGTAFNPEISVCDWPHKIPGCSEETTTQNPRTIDGPNYRPHQPNWNNSPSGNVVQGRPTGQYDQNGPSAQHQGGHGLNGHQDRRNPYENRGEGHIGNQWQPGYPVSKPSNSSWTNGQGRYQPSGSGVQGRPSGQYDQHGSPTQHQDGHVLNGHQDRRNPYENRGEGHIGNQWQPGYPVSGPYNSSRTDGQGRYPPNYGKPTLDPLRPFQPIPTYNSNDRIAGQGPHDHNPYHNHHHHDHDGPGPWDHPGHGYPMGSDEEGSSQVPSTGNGNANGWEHHHAHGPGPWNHPGYDHRGNGDKNSPQVPSTGENANGWQHHHDHHPHNGPGPWDHPGHTHGDNGHKDNSQVPHGNPNGWEHHRDHDYPHRHDGPGPWDHSAHNHGENGKGDGSQVSLTPDKDPNHWQPENHHQDGYHNPQPNHGNGNWNWGNRATTTEIPNTGFPNGDRGSYGRTNPNFPGQYDSTGNNQGGWSPSWSPGSGSVHDDRMKPSQPVPVDPQPGTFVPNPWRGQGWNDPGQQGPKSNPTSPPKTEWSQGGNKSPQDQKFDDWLSKTNVIHRGDSRKDQDAKMDDWKSKTNIFAVQKGTQNQGSKTSQDPDKNGPSGIYVTVNGIKGHYITKEIEINEGHSNTRNYGKGSTDSPPIFNNNYADNSHTTVNPLGWRVPNNTTYPNKYEQIGTNLTTNRWTPPKYKPNYDKYPIKPAETHHIFTTEKPDSDMGSYDQVPRFPPIERPEITIETTRDHERYNSNAGKQNETLNFAEIAEPDIDKYEVDVLDDKEKWKPKIVNKTKKANDNSVIMSINKRKDIAVEILDVKLASSPDEEPPFPAYYVAPVLPMGHKPKPMVMVHGTGQILRLRGGSSPRDGYLEVQGAYPGWGVVCDSRNGWSLNEAHVVCRQLGYTRGAEMAWQGRAQRDEDGFPWIAATTVNCKGNETSFQTCKFVHDGDCHLERDSVGIRCMANRVAHCGKDEVAHDGQCYHLAPPDSGLNHAEASDYCAARKSQLVDITSQAENNFLSEWLIQSYPDVKSIMTSGVGFSTFNRTIWMWEDSTRAKFQFSKWWPGWMNEKKVTPSAGSRPVCIVMKNEFPCQGKPETKCPTEYFFWDVEDCAASMNGHSFVCERPYNDISCVYGKGQHYAGSANVSASGKDCLPWKHQNLAHALRVNVLNQEVREKLKTHNYCRNPNPMKESRPWCFIGLRGERESCDIPSCGKIETPKSIAGGQCKPKHFECMPGECIPSPWVCDGDEDCTNGLDEKFCSSNLEFFQKTKDHKLEGHEIQKWLDTPAKTCALRCKEADFTCRSFSHKSKGNVCFLSDSNVGLTGDLHYDVDFDYYEMIDRSINCESMFVCGNQKCINQTQVCDGKNNCGDRTDENICSLDHLGYEIRLAGSNNSYEGRIEVKVLGHWGQVCDDGFGMIDANVVCKELGFNLGALEVRPGGYYGNLDPPERFMVDQLKCRGNETSLRECDFEGWGVHNCRPEEAVGVVCKSAVNTCQLGHWKCDNSPTCIPTPFICDEVVDCPDGSDENSAHCDAPFELRLVNGSSPLEGRVEVRHHGVWGTVCDDDFSQTAAAVICKSLGYGGKAIPKKNGFFGPGDGPIWLDEVYCHGSEPQLYKCEHDPWGRSNCDHEEDAGVICTEGSVNDSEETAETTMPVIDINDLLPSDCGKRAEDFGDGDIEIFQRVVRGSIAPKGSYPWQASIRVRGHSRSSHWCGAVVLSPLHVLTAAHCLEGYNKGTYFVRAGDYNSEIDEGTEVEANIEDYYVHEEFRKGARMNNDIALVRLKGQGIPLGEHVMPICLPPANAEYSPGLNCTISGFGSVETGQSVQSLNLRYGWVPLIDQSVCRADYVYGKGRVSDGMVCAGFLNEGVDACDGDSGGPLACLNNGAYTLYGLTSWGHHCGEANKPGVYVRIAYYRDWIERKIRESLYGR